MKAVICGTVLLVVAGALTLATEDLGFAQFLLMLVGGWCFGFAFVNLTFRMQRNGLFLHVAAAVVFGAAMVVMTEYGSRILELLPETARGLLVVVQMAAIPATGWIWIGLLGRATDALTRRERRNAPVRNTVEWERDESGDGSFITFTAIEMPMRRLTWAIVCVVLFVGAAGVALLIGFTDVVAYLPAKLSIILIGLVLGLPAYAALTAVMRRGTADCRLAFGNDEIRLQVGETASVIRFADLEHLRWRCASDYARIEVRGSGVDHSLITGIAKPTPGRTAELPQIPRRVFTRLERLGLRLERARRGDVVTFAARYPGKRPLRQETP